MWLSARYGLVQEMQIMSSKVNVDIQWGVNYSHDIVRVIALNGTSKVNEQIYDKLQGQTPIQLV